jgi:type III secretion protein Q
VAALEAVVAASVPGDGLLSAARSLLARGNLLQLASEQGVLILHAGRGQQHAASLPSVRLDHAYGSVLVALEQESGESNLGDARWHDYEGDARLLAWTLAHESLVSALAQLTGHEFLPAAFLTAGGDLERLWLALIFRDHQGALLQGWLALSPAELRTLAARQEWTRDATYPALVSDATSLSLRLIMAGRTLDAASVAALKPGDVLLVGHEADCEGRLQPDEDTVRNIYGLPAGWAVQRRQGEWTISNRPLIAVGSDTARPLFLLTRLTLGLDDVGALRPGSTLHYDAPLVGSTVGIMLGGRRFGEGVLVALGDWLGVRIVQREGEHGLQ